MTVRQFLSETKKELIRPKVKLKDNTVMSIQCSHYHYCTKDKNGIPLTVEVMSTNCPELVAIADDDYIVPNLPIDVLEQIVEKHGGIVCLL